MSVPFRERNPVTIGAVGIALIFLLLLAAFRADDLPLIGGGDTYYAEFSESGGLQVNDEVRIAGVRVGKVNSIELDGDKVKVAFKVSADTGFGDGHARGDQGQDAAGRDVPLPRAGRIGSAQGGLHDPARAHVVTVRRGRRLLRPG